MAKKLKVYGGSLDGRIRYVVAAPSWVACRDVVHKHGHTNASLHYLKEYWGLTGNYEEIEMAMRNPLTLIMTGKL